MGYAGRTAVLDGVKGAVAVAVAVGFGVRLTGAITVTPAVGGRVGETGAQAADRATASNPAIQAPLHLPMTPVPLSLKSIDGELCGKCRQ